MMFEQEMREAEIQQEYERRGTARGYRYSIGIVLVNVLIASRLDRGWMLFGMIIAIGLLAFGWVTTGEIEERDRHPILASLRRFLLGK
jgi:hypothetical protein